MTLVRMSFAVPAPDGTVTPASGMLRFTPTARRTVTGAPDTVVLPASFQVQLVAGAATVTLEPSTASWVWRVDEYLTGVTARTIYAQVPDAVEADYTDLTPIDPATLLPNAAPEPAWVAMANSTVSTAAVDAAGDLILTRTDGTTVNAGNVRGATDSTAAAPHPVADDTPAAPAEGMSASYFVTSAVTWPAGIVWSSDPDNDMAPTITGTAFVSMFTLGGLTRGVLGATFPAVSTPDTTPPTVGTMAVSAITATGFTLTVSGASDTTALHATPYAFTIDNGVTYSAYQSSPTYAASELVAETAYSANWRVRDAAGNVSTGTPQTVTTTAASTYNVTETFTYPDESRLQNINETLTRPTTTGGLAWQMRTTPLLTTKATANELIIRGGKVIGSVSSSGGGWATLTLPQVSAIIEADYTFGSGLTGTTRSTLFLAGSATQAIYARILANGTTSTFQAYRDGGTALGPSTTGLPLTGRLSLSYTAATGAVVVKVDGATILNTTTTVGLTGVIAGIESSLTGATLDNLAVTYL